MVKKLALSLPFSGVFLFGPPQAAMASAGDNPSMSLTQESLSEPATITAWLQKNEQTADRRIAKRYFDLGVAAEKHSQWSRAVKAFGESALFFPAPNALVKYADNSLRDRSKVRRHQVDKGIPDMIPDLQHALAVYRSARAANAALKSLSASAVNQLEADEACLGAYVDAALQKKEAVAPKQKKCRPLALYGLTHREKSLQKPVIPAKAEI